MAIINTPTNIMISIANLTALKLDQTSPSSKVISLSTAGNKETFRPCFEFGDKGDYRNFYDKFSISGVSSLYAKSLIPSYLELEDKESADRIFVPPSYTPHTYESYLPFVEEPRGFSRSRDSVQE